MLFTYLLPHGGDRMLIQVILQMLEESQMDILTKRDPEECIQYIRESLPSKADMVTIAKATQNTEVSTKRLKELEDI